MNTNSFIRKAAIGVALGAVAAFGATAVPAMAADGSFSASSSRASIDNGESTQILFNGASSVVAGEGVCFRMSTPNLIFPSTYKAVGESISSTVTQASMKNSGVKSGDVVTVSFYNTVTSGECKLGFVRGTPFTSAQFTFLNTPPVVVAPPVVEEPVVTPPVVEEPVVTPPVAEEPVVAPPVTEGPVAQEPVLPPVAEEPALPPVADLPVTDEPVADEPVKDEPTVDEPTVDEPTVDEPVKDEPVKDEPVADEPTVDEPVTDEPTKDEPATDAPATDEPVKDEPVTDEPATDAPATDEPAALPEFDTTPEVPTFGADLILGADNNGDAAADADKADKSDKNAPEIAADKLSDTGADVNGSLLLALALLIPGAALLIGRRKSEVTV